MRGLSLSCGEGAWRAWDSEVAEVPRYFFSPKPSAPGTAGFLQKKMKRRQFPEAVLNRPISSLEVSQEFKEITHQYGYETLADILSLPTPYKLLEHPGFGYRMLMQYVSFLEEQGLGSYLN